MAQVPVEEGVFTWPNDSDDAVRLIGSKCSDCGNVMFPSQNSCPKCSGSSTEEHHLKPEGTLWTWTIQGYPPKSPPYAGNDDPKTFEPFGVGYVELADECKVETRLTVSEPEEMRIGMEMKLVLVPLYTNDDGDEVMTFAFAPTAPDQ